MKKVVVIGGGPVGLATAILLANDGLAVTVLEKDPQPGPSTADRAWTWWERPGVAQFRHTHFMHPRFRHMLDSDLPEVREAIVALGGRSFDPLTTLPPALRAPMPGDDRFRTLTARRPVLESAFAHVATQTPVITIRRGVSARSLLPGRCVHASVAHARGVLTSTGERILADLVVDASGRRSKLTDWVQALDPRSPIDEASDAGFAYYTRHFRSRTRRLPEYRGPIVVYSGTVGVVAAVADNGTWSMAVMALAGDQPFKALRHAPVWEAVVRSFPTAAHWLDGIPISDVMPMAGVLDRRRRLVVDGRPAVAGVVPVGDAWACTNPSAGRGFSLGVWQAILLRDAVRRCQADPVELVEAYADATDRLLAPWYQDQHDRDRRRAAQFRALVEARPPEPDPVHATEMALIAAGRDDPDAARGWLDVVHCLALPHEVLARPGIRDKVNACLRRTPKPPPGPTRHELLRLIDAERPVQASITPPAA